jgi:uncharacterized membrane protein
VFNSESDDQMRAPDWLRTQVLGIEQATGTEPIATALTGPAQWLAKGFRGQVLKGNWLGHALHPLLTDLPLGCWLASGLLDLGGGRRSRSASRQLVGLGIIAAVPTAASGLAEWADLTDVRLRRVGAVHAAGNAVMVATYVLSWRARGRHQHWRGVALGLAGGGLGWATGYLGGHMSFNLAAGVGDRGLRWSPARD